MTTRSDLLALDENALATLANRGLVKRATKEIERGTGPTVELLDDGTVIGRTETTVTTLPPNTPLKKSECTCGAASVCRHRVATVLAYQRSVSAEATAADHGDATTATPVSAADRIRAPLPSLDVDDEALQARLGKSAWATAQTGPKPRLLGNPALRRPAPGPLAHVYSRISCPLGPQPRPLRLRTGRRLRARRARGVGTT